MQHCGKCGHYNTDESIFCSHCGHRLNNRCQDCGFPNLPQQVFCGNCGKQLHADTAVTDTETPAPPSAAAPLPPAAEETPPPPAEPATPEAGEEVRFEDYATLEHYALASIEVANREQLQAAATSPEQLDSAIAEALQRIERQAFSTQADVSLSKRQVLFAAFRKAGSLEASLQAAIDFGLHLLQQESTALDVPLQLKIGLDIEAAQARNPLTSTLERSIGLPGSLTTSEAAYQHVSRLYQAEPIGPMPVGNRMMQFYRIIRPGGALPDIEAVTEVNPTKPPPAPETWMDETLPASETVLPEPEVAHPEPPLPPPAPKAPAPQPSETLPPSPDSSEAGVLPEPEPYAAEPPLAQEPAGTETGHTPPPPPTVYYDAPILGIRKTTRPPNLGYEQVIEALTSELSGFLAQGVRNKGKVVALCGADGLGKSNIINLVRSRLDPENQRAFWMGGHNYRCFHRNELPLCYWLELVQNLLSLVFEGQPAREVKEQVNRFLAYVHEGHLPAQEQAFLLDFLSVQPLEPLAVDSRDNLGRIEEFFFGFFKTLTEKRPLVLIVEDLHFADTTSLDLLNRLLERGLLEHPVYLLFTQSRDFYASGALSATLQKGAYKELVVAELDEAETVRYLDDGPLGGKLQEFPPPLIDTLLQHARGLPIYLEEALRLFHLRELITVDSQTHKFVMHQTFDPAEAMLPGDLTALIRMRMEFLSEKTLYLLRLASVLGEKFSVGMLMALAQAEEQEFNQALTTLFNHGYLLPDAANTGRFRHGLIWQAVYEDIPPDLRLQMHQLISEALENDFNQRLTVNPMMIAYHAENGQLPNRALNYWNLAGIFAGQVGSLTGMNMAMFRALELLRDSQPEPLHRQELALRIVESLGVFNLSADPDFAVQMLEWVFFYRQQEGDFTKLIEPLGFLASAYETKGDFPQALATLEKALELVDARKYPLEAASLLINKMEHLYMLGRLQQARQMMAQRIEPIAEQQGKEHADPDFYDAYLQARLLLGQILLAQCDPESWTVLEHALEQAKARNLDGLTIALQLALAQAMLRNGQYDNCNREADHLLNAIEAMGDAEWFLAQWGLLAMMYHCEMEDWESASQLVLTVVSKAESARDHHTWILAQTYAGYISGQMGKTKEARQVLEQAIGLSSDHRFASAALLGWRFLADFELSLGGAEVAHEIATKAISVAQKPEIRHTDELFQLSLISARALMTQGNVKAAGKLLEPLWPQVIKSRMQPLIAACAFEIGQLYKHLAHNAPADLSRKHLMRSVEFFLKAKGIWLELRHLPNVKKVDATMPKL